MAIDDVDIHGAAETVGKAITDGLTGPDFNTLSGEQGQVVSVTGGLFAIANAIKDLADAIREQSE